MYEWASGTGEFCAILLHGSSSYVCDSMPILAVFHCPCNPSLMYCSVVCSLVTWLTLPPPTLHPSHSAQFPLSRPTRIIPSTPFQNPSIPQEHELGASTRFLIRCWPCRVVHSVILCARAKPCTPHCVVSNNKVIRIEQRLLIYCPEVMILKSKSLRDFCRLPSFCFVLACLVVE